MFYLSGGARLFAITMGSGPDVVLLHPTPVHHAFWLPVAEMLADRYRVTLPDLRGHGQSEAGDGPITLEKLGGDIERLLETLGIGKALFAGCSIGGYTLYEIWRRMPERVAALAFCCSKPQADVDANRATRQKWIAQLKERGTADFIESMLNSLVGPTAWQRHPEKIAEARAMMQAMQPEAVVAVQQGLALRPDSVETAKTIRVPTFVLAGVEDTGSTPADMRLLTRMVRNGGYGAEFHLLNDAGHYAPWEQPETVGPLLRKFFDSVVG